MNQQRTGLIANDSIVVFDFDKTIISKDTYREFLVFLTKKSLIRSALALSFLPLLLIMFAGPLTRVAAVNIFSAISLLGQRKSLWQLRREFFQDFYSKPDTKYFASAINAIQSHQSNCETILILSGCPTWLLGPAIRHAGLNNVCFMGSRQKLSYGSLVLTDFCYANHKLTMAERLGFSDLSWSKGYSDSLSDLPFLDRCNTQTVVNASPKQLQKFTKALGDKCNGVRWS